MHSSPLERLERALRSFLTIAVALILAAIASICFIEVVRRPFGGSFVWYDEFVGYLLVWLTFLGAVLARSYHQHIGIDNVLESVSPGARRVLELTTHGLMVAVHVVLLIYGAQLVLRFLTERAITVDIPVGLVYLVIPLSAVFMLLIEAIQIARLFTSPDLD
ncbi:MAG: 2,3-diketo-L-gulonate TRAP transporter small permease YiaM [Acidobacteriota bacterium]|nr:MAG: 2,3-diketo-L-gulonate TRAP transporter small permease YiaM [Acidobacteriota bacterium]